MTKEELLKAYLEKDKELDALRKALEKRRNALIDQMNEALRAEFGERRDMLTREYNALKAQLDDVEDAERTADTLSKLPYPLGTVLIGWERRGYGGGFFAVGKGVLEICTKDTVHPENMKYQRAHVGELLIRFLGKNGEPTKRYEKLVKWSATKWRLPEEGSPDQKKAAKSAT